MNDKKQEKTEASEIYKKILDSGIEEYSENEIIIWTERFPAVQNELK